MQQVRRFALKQLRLAGPRVLATALVSLLITAGLGLALAQTTIGGRRSGTGTDKKKAVIAGGEVKVTGGANSAVRHVPTDARGGYVVTNLAGGNYRGVA